MALPAYYFIVRLCFVERQAGPGSGSSGRPPWRPWLGKWLLAVYGRHGGQPLHFVSGKLGRSRESCTGAITMGRKRDHDRTCSNAELRTRLDYSDRRLLAEETLLRCWPPGPLAR